MLTIAPSLRLLSSQPQKRFAESLFLLYTPIWVMIALLCHVTRVFETMSDAGHLALGFIMALPLWILPIARPCDAERHLPLHERYLTKVTVFIALMSLVQNSLGAWLFFRSLGMEYHFNVRLVLGGTPVFIYFVTVAYFTTYFTLIQIGLRAFQSRFPNAPAATLWLVLAFLSYSVAFLETLIMANDLIRPYFSYANKGRTLLFGSICYGTLFFICMPVYLRIDRSDKRRTPLAHVVLHALFANALILMSYWLYERYFLPYV